MSRETDTIVDKLASDHFWEHRAGGCHVLALAIHKLTCWPLAGVMRCDDDPEDTPGAPRFQGEYSDVAHVYCVPPYDVSKRRDPCMFDCEGVGDLDSYIADVSIETGWGEVDDTRLDESDVHALVELGWLRDFTDENLQQATIFARELLLDEGVPPGMIAPETTATEQPSRRERVRP